MRWTVLCSAVLLGASACSEYDIHAEQPEIVATAPVIQVTPEVLDFGAIPEGQSLSGFFLVENVGDAPLVLGNLKIQGSPAFELTTTASGVQLEPGQTADGMVVYTAGAAAAAGNVLVPSNDSERPEVRVQLLGDVGDEPPPPPPPDPEPPTAMCAVNPPVTEAVFGSADLVGDTSFDPNGQALTYTWTGVMRPSGSSAVIPGVSTSTDPNRLGFVPDVAGTYGFQLVVTNEDGLDSTVCYTELVATDPTFPRPVAVCSVNPPVTEAISGSADLIGSASYDPSGLSLTYTWTILGRPAGSGANIPGLVTSSNPNRYGFNPDLVGFYDFQLVVTNSAGEVSDPCVTSLEAIPSQDLWVEMFWTYSGDDMDLHLTRAGGALVSTQDCYYGNCVWGGPDWGPAGASGNPSLDLDDISGTGPENINVDTPENVIYNVWVHDYPGSVYSGANPVTVNIYLSGSLAWTDTRSLSIEDQYVQFADVDWATQTVIPR